MRLKNYMRDYLPALIGKLVFGGAFCMILKAYRVPDTLKTIFLVTYFITELSWFLWDYLRKIRFYNELISKTEQLDQKYLVLETMRISSFYEGRLFCQILYEINKSMCENVNSFRKSMTDFKEYIELWVHEMKLPLASLQLMFHNCSSEQNKKYLEQIRKMDRYTEQILYYVRSEHMEKDFLIKEVEMDKLIKKVAINNKDDLLGRNITLSVNLDKRKVLTDGKWLEFILNQIINNSMKYQDLGKQSWIQICIIEQENRTGLSVKDNGIGIPSSDLPRVFEKSFTGINGRGQAKSTGMGLYLAKQLCTCLGHKIEINSKQGEYTEVLIWFAKNDFYKM